MRKGSLVRYIGDRKFPHGKMLSVHAVDGETVTVYTECVNGKWKTTHVPKKELEVVVE